MFCRRTAHLLFAILIIVPAAAAQDGHLWVGPNVNMVSGTTFPDGDPFLQRQNEPSCAVSTRNHLHIFCGANDYRTVDIPGLPDGKPTGDSWIGTFQSLDGGGSWTSTLLPCYPQDDPMACASSDVYLLQAAADPVMRAGVQGFFALSGIVFNRGENPHSKVFVSRFIDLNNDPNIPIQYVDTVEVASNEVDLTKFIDKPWMAIDIPRGGEEPWSFDVNQGGFPLPQQTIQCGAMYLAWAEIESGATGVIASDIMFSSSTDCGSTWVTLPDPISDPETINQGATIAIEPETGNVHVAWRQFNSLALPDGDGCVLGPGFWKTHPELWSSAVLQLGGVFYNHVQLLGFMETPPRGDATYILAEQLIPAKLNRVDELYEDAADLIEEADLWLTANPIGSRPKKEARDEGIALATYIKIYNIGLDPSTCVPASGDVQNAIMVASSGPGGLSFGSPEPVSTLEPFDQGTTTYSFRSSAYPSMTADATGRLYLAWTTRGVAEPAANPDPFAGDARIVVSTSNDGGSNWTIPQPIDEPTVPGHQIKPSITFTAGKLLLGYYDFREDVSGDFGGFIADLPIPGLFRHTVDVRAAIADPGDFPVFTNYPVLRSSQTSRYPFILVGNDEYDAEMAQLKWNPPNYPMFRSGNVPFFSDYLDIAAAPSFVSDGYGGWTYNVDTTRTATAFQVWTDDRDVIPPPDGDWTNYYPPTHPNSGGTSIFDGSTEVPECVPGTDDEDRTGMRNQNVYSARLTEGLYVAVPGNSRPLGCHGGNCPGDLFQRAFVIFVRNSTDDERSFRLLIDEQPQDGIASFDQFDPVPLMELDVTIERQSSASRTVFVSSSELHKSVRVEILEIDAPGGGVIGDGLQSAVMLNPDPTNPSPYDSSLNQEEIYNPAIYNPAILNPAILNPAILNPAILNPAILNPAIYNPAILNPAILNPAIYNPAILNPAIYNTTMTDMTWEMTNEGNAPMAYSLNLSAAGVLPSELIFQLMVYRIYTTPVSNGCELTEEAQHELLVNVNDPSFSPLRFFDPDVDNPDVVSFYLEPGDSALITLRVFDPDADNEEGFSPADVQPAVVAQGVNTADALLGETQPPYVVFPMPNTMNAGRVQHTSTVLDDGRVLIAGGFNPLQTESSAEIYDPATGLFTPTGSMAVPRATHSATLLDDGTVLVVGIPSGGVPGPSAEIYDPVLGTFSPTTNGDLNVPRGGHRATKLPDGRVLITGGSASGPGFLNSAEIYDPSEDNFELLTEYMLEPRVEHTATLLTDGTVLITGGWGGPELSLDSAEIFDPVEGDFTITDTLTEARRYHSANLLPNGKVLIAGGILSGSGLSSTASADIYDPATGFFTPAGNMTDVRAGHIAEILPSGQILIAGGSDVVGGIGRFIASVDLFDWSTNTFASAGNLTEARAEHAAARLLSGDILITGGTTPGSPVTNGTDTYEIYHPGLPPKFLRTGDLNEGRNYHRVVGLAGGDVLVVGGVDSDFNGITAIERYDAGLGTFSAVATMPTTRSWPTVTLLQDGTVLIAGGYDGVNDEILASALIYDPADDSLESTVQDMELSRYWHSATLLQDGRVLIVGGRGSASSYEADAEIYDPADGSFSLSGSLTTGRCNHTATLLDDGRVLIAGGDVAGGVTNTFQVWDSGTFDTESGMNDDRVRASATLLVDGSVLIAGGRDASWNSHETAEIFDPVGDTFTYTLGTMKLGRRTHASIRLPSGQVLIAGGAGDGSVLLSGAEVYDPVTQTFELTDVLNVARSSPQAAALSNGSVMFIGGWEIYGVGVVVPSKAAEFYSGPLHGKTLWTRQFGTSSSEEVLGVSVGSTAVYVGGYTVGTLPGQTGLGGSDAFVRKYDFAGNEVWTRQFGTSGGDRVTALSVDASAVYVTGYTNGSFPGQTGAGGDDVFVRRYDLAGNEVWTRQFGTSSYDRVADISVGSTAVYVGGYTAGTLPGQTSLGGADAFVRKYDFAGNEVWTRQFGTSVWDDVISLSTDASDVYAAGDTDGAFPGQTSGGSRDAFVRKFDFAGNEVWTRQFGTGAWDAALSIATSSSAAYVGGFTGGSLPGQTSAGADDAFVRKYDLAGNEVWTRQFGGDAGDYAQEVSVRPSGTYVAGFTSGTLPGQTSAGGTDNFVRRYDLAGKQIWTRQFGGTDHDAAWAIAGDSLAVYVGGYTRGTLPGQVSSGGWDAFVEKLVP